jgi:hypothetical protein
MRRRLSTEEIAELERNANPLATVAGGFLPPSPRDEIGFATAAERWAIPARRIEPPPVGHEASVLARWQGHAALFIGRVIERVIRAGVGCLRLALALVGSETIVRFERHDLLRASATPRAPSHASRDSLIERQRAGSPAIVIRGAT